MPSALKICDIASTVRAKRERRKEARPGELLSAALDLFVEKGYAATRVEEVAMRAGVSKGTLFLYFPSKEELFKAVVRANISGRFAEWAQELEQYEGTSADLIRYCMRSWWERIGSTKASGISKLMMSEASNFPELAHFYQHEVVQTGEDLIRRILQRGVLRGELRPMDMQYAVYSIVASMMYLIMWKHALAGCADTRMTLDPLKYIDAQLDTILNGIRAQAASADQPTSV